jgi:putative transposase
MPKQSTTKPLAVDYFKVPRRLWRIMKKHLPAEHKPGPAGGRPRIGNRAVLNGIWYLLWTGAQWKAIRRDWFGVSSSVLHERFQSWQKQGVWDAVFRALVKFYRRERHIQWRWQAVDSRSCAAPLGGAETGKNPTDRAKLGSKIHILVDQRGAPLAIDISGANQHDKWSVEHLVFHVAVRRPHSQQNFCADKGYDYEDIHQLAEREGYVPHIKHRRRRGEPKIETCPAPGETQFPARRWVVERTFAWLVKRRSVRTRWCKKASNWLAFVQLACASILCDMAVYG